MGQFLYHYRPVEPATWFYLSSLLMIGLFFKFSRFWSVRNLDLILLILLGPGLLFVHYGRQAEREYLFEQAARAHAAEKAASVGFPGSGLDQGAELAAPARFAPGADGPIGRASEASAAPAGEAGLGDATQALEGSEPLGAARFELALRAQKYGYLWLFGVQLLWLIRLLADATMVRRPLLEPNLTAGGLTFIGCSLFVFLMANVITQPDPAKPEISPQRAVEQGEQRPPAVPLAQREPPSREGPGYALLSSLPTGLRKGLAIFAHLAIVLGMVLIGYWHFDNIVMGIGAATLYLMLPYTALMTSEVRHALPGAALVWAILCYRRPIVAGALLGLAGGITYYPLFLLPLWISFYWPRGLLRFLLGVTLVLLILSLVLIASGNGMHKIRLMFGLLPPAMNGLSGIWDPRLDGWSSYYRIPVIVAFVALAVSMAIWPAQKNLGTLLSCSAAVMVATQFWHGYGGGLYMAWYLPLILLTVFRPNLEDRVALTVLGDGWFPRRLATQATGQAA